MRVKLALAGRRLISGGLYDRRRNAEGLETEDGESETAANPQLAGVQIRVVAELFGGHAGNFYLPGLDVEA